MAARKLTVVQMLPALESGGVERGTLEVGAALAQKGHRSIVISAGGAMVAELQAGGSEHVAWPVGHKSLLTLRYVPRLRRYLREQRVDVLHARSRLPAWIAYLAWRGMDPATRPRFVTTVHGFYSVGRYSAVMTRGERVIAVSEAVRDYLRTNYPGLDQGRVVVIPRGVDRERYPYGYKPSAAWREEWARQFPELREKWTLTLPGRITRLKGHEHLLSIVARLRERSIPAHGLVVGGSHPKKRRYLQELRDRVEQQRLAGHITFVGQRTDLREILSFSDVVLSLSSAPESFGRTTMEALSLGRPVLGYDHGGVGEQLRTAFPAGAVPPGDWQEAARRLERWYPEAPRPAEAYPFTLHHMVVATIELYSELCSEVNRDSEL